MKKLLVLFLTLSPMLLAQPIANSKRAQAKDELVNPYKVIPHVAASFDWTTVLLFRNDQDRTITLRVNIYDPSGAATNATFFDIEGNRYTANEIDLVMNPFGMATVEFDALPNGLRSVQVFVSATEDDLLFSVETLLHNFETEGKVATVGLIDQLPFNSFFMNVDRRFDRDTGNQKFRGIAITNVATSDCDCTIDLFDEFSSIVATEPLSIPGSGKELFALDEFFNNMDDILPLGVGLIRVVCDQQVSALGLAFETNASIVGSIPIDYFEIVDGKRVTRKK